MNIGRSEDTICAISTPHGVGGIAVVRVSGPDAVPVVDGIWRGRKLSEVDSHTAHLGMVIGDDDEVLDQCVATVFRAPRSFTGEDVVELSVHGSQWIQRQVVNRLIRCGCRMATAGEFTRRAFASGRMDLAEAEGVADLIASSSKASHRLAVSQMRGHFSSRLRELREHLVELSSLLELELDFSEEEVEFASRDKLTSLAGDILSLTRRLADSFATGSAIKDGVPVAIVGATNAGKSTILNQLLHEDRAIVSDIHGTTRDTIEDTMEIGGVLFRIIDTAGLRQTSDAVEALGIERALSELDKARIVVWVVDCSDEGRNASVWEKISERLTIDHKLIIARNKVDLLDGFCRSEGADGFLGCVESADVDSGTPCGDVDGCCTESLPVAGLQDEAMGCRYDESTGRLNEKGSLRCPAFKTVNLVAKEGQGIDRLREALVEASGISQIAEGDVMVTNARHYEALVNATEALERVMDGLRSGISGDFIAQDIRLALHYLGEITGEITTQDILTTIFSRFCIGK